MKLDIRKILVPVDFSDTSAHALEHAGWLAATVKAELLLVHVLPENHYYYEAPEPVAPVTDGQKSLKRVEDRMRAMIADLHTRYGVNIRHKILQGRISAELMDTIESDSIDLVMMGTHGAKGLEEILIGSNAQNLVSLATCPVMTFQKEKTMPGFSNIILPIDRSRHSREKVGITVSIAKACHAKIHMLGLLDNDDEGEYEKLQIVLDQVQMVIDREEIPFTRHTVKGDNIANEALKYAKSISADLIVILTEEESVLGKLDLGPLSRHIVNHSPIPVLSMNPHYGKFESLDLTGAYQAY